MTTRWSAPILAAGLAAFAGTPAAFGGYFGCAGYSIDVPPGCCAQTHFVESVGTSGVETAGYSADAASMPNAKIVYVDEVRTAFETVSETTYRKVQETISQPYTDTVMKPVRQTITRPIYETVPRAVRETTYLPVREKVLRECRTTVYDEVCETQIQERTVDVPRKVWEPITQTICIQVSKPLSETVYRNCQRTVCKPIVESHERECKQVVWTPVTETGFRETSRVVLRETTETVMKDVYKKVHETVNCTRTIAKTVPTTVCEMVAVPARLTWQHVPKYVCAFDPCTCSTVQKQDGTVRRLVYEPAHKFVLEVVRNKTVFEEVPETETIEKIVVEKIPTVVTKKVPTVVYEKVPVTIVRQVPSTQTFKIPYTTTRMVATIEVVRVPVSVHRTARGCYVDATALTKSAAALAAKGVDCIPGGAAALGKADAPTYEFAAEGRIFVEGLPATKKVTHYEPKTIRVVEVQKVTHRTTRMVAREVVQRVPTTITRLLPVATTRVVPYSTCRIATEEVVMIVPTQVARTRSVVVAKCLPEVVSRRVPRTTLVKTARVVTISAPDCSCQQLALPIGPCRGTPKYGAESWLMRFGFKSPWSSRVGGPCETPCCSCTSCGSPRALFATSCHPHPIRDFFNRLWSNRLNCSACQAVPAGPTVAAPGIPPPAPMPKAPLPATPTTLPPYNPE